MPQVFDLVAPVGLALGGGCALLIAADIWLGRRQSMWIMDLVWPITALYSGPLGLWAYWRLGRPAASANGHGHQHAHHQPSRPFWQTVVLGTTHCGAGCTLGDLTAEVFLGVVPFALFGREVFAAWTLDFVLAFAFGIAFQYFAIAPMRQITRREALAAAVKSDALSLTAWQVGMYGFMALVEFGPLGPAPAPSKLSFWLAMQMAMLAGFVTSYPVNWWLVRSGIKHPM